MILSTFGFKALFLVSFKIIRIEDNWFLLIYYGHSPFSKKKYKIKYII